MRANTMLESPCARMNITGKTGGIWRTDPSQPPPPPPPLGTRQFAKSLPWTTTILVVDTHNLACHAKSLFCMRFDQAPLLSSRPCFGCNRVCGDLATPTQHAEFFSRNSFRNHEERGAQHGGESSSIFLEEISKIIRERWNEVTKINTNIFQGLLFLFE